MRAAAVAAALRCQLAGSQRNLYAYSILWHSRRQEQSQMPACRLGNLTKQYKLFNFLGGFARTHQGSRPGPMKKVDFTLSAEG